MDADELDADEPHEGTGPRPPAHEVAELGPRAHRTRESIVEAARGLFLSRGYAGTSVADITGACGISRAGFYTYFRDKRDVFSVLGRASYRSSMAVVKKLAELPAPSTAEALSGWIREYFAHLDVHGAFALAATLSGPPEADFRADSHRTQIRVAGTLGTLVHHHHRPSQPGPPGPPEVAGLVLVAMIEQCWYQLRRNAVLIDEDDVVAELAAMVLAVSGPG